MLGLVKVSLAPSSRGLGYQVFILEITGSNPVGATKVRFFLKHFFVSMVL
jgi:hypothetical protein